MKSYIGEFAQALNTAIAQLTAEIAFLHSELIRIQQETDAAIQLRKEEHETFQKAKRRVLLLDWGATGGE